MTVQTSVADAPDAARLGGLYDARPHKIVTRRAEAAVPFGRAVVKGTGDTDVKIPSATTDITDHGKFQGVAVATHALESVADSNPAQYAAKDEVNVLQTGAIWMWAEEAVTPTDQVFVRFTANGASKLPGMVRTDADTGKAVALTGARFLASTSGAALVPVEITIPGVTL